MKIKELLHKAEHKELSEEIWHKIYKHIACFVEEAKHAIPDKAETLEKEIEELFEEISLELENEYSEIDNKEVDKKDLSAIFLVINRLFKGYDSKLYEIIYKNN